MKKGFEKIFVDTAPLIYFIEHNIIYKKSVATYFESNRLELNVFYTSVLSIAEFNVLPEKKKELKPIQDLQDFLDVFEFNILNIDSKIAQLSAKLRAKYIYLRTIDSLQIAAAINNNCNTFFTNDKNLKAITEIMILTLDDL